MHSWTLFSDKYVLHVFHFSILVHQIFHMIKSLCCLLFLIAVFNGYAQTDFQQSILMDKKIITVSKTCDEKDMIILSNNYWDDMVKGTPYTSSRLPVTGYKEFRIEIADKVHGLCKTGIGFGCGIFNYDSVTHRSPQLINNECRVCSVLIKRETLYSVRIIFNDVMDWESLQGINITGNHKIKTHSHETNNQAYSSFIPVAAFW